MSSPNLKLLLLGALWVSSSAWARCAMPDLVRTFEHYKTDKDSIAFVGRIANAGQMTGQATRLDGTAVAVKSLAMLYSRRAPVAKMSVSPQLWIAFPNVKRTAGKVSYVLPIAARCGGGLFPATPENQGILKQCLAGACPPRLMKRGY